MFVDELVKKLVNDSSKYGFKWLGDYAFQYEDLFIELRTETLTDENNCWEMDFAIFKSIEDMNTDYDLNIADDYWNIENSKEYWEHIQDIINTIRFRKNVEYEKEIDIVIKKEVGKQLVISVNYLTDEGNMANREVVLFDEFIFNKKTNKEIADDTCKSVNDLIVKILTENRR